MNGLFVVGYKPPARAIKHFWTSDDTTPHCATCAMTVAVCWRSASYLGSRTQAVSQEPASGGRARRPLNCVVRLARNKGRPRPQWTCRPVLECNSTESVQSRPSPKGLGRLLFVLRPLASSIAGGESSRGSIGRGSSRWCSAGCAAHGARHLDSFPRELHIMHFLTCPLGDGEVAISCLIANACRPNGGC